MGAARAVVEGAGIVAAVARRRKSAEEVTKFRPNTCVAHCSGVRVLCVWPKGVKASYFEFDMRRKECGDVSAVV